jgi:hypothetical protein
MVNEEEQPIQWLMKDKNTSNDLQNTTDKTKDWATRALLKTGSELRYSRVSTSCSTSGTRCVTIIKNPMKSHEEEKADATVTTPNRTYPCSSVPHIFRNG